MGKKKEPQVKFADPLTWTPRAHKGHPFRCMCYQCERNQKWTEGYLAYIRKVDR